MYSDVLTCMIIFTWSSCRLRSCFLCAVPVHHSSAQTVRLWFGFSWIYVWVYHWVIDVYILSLTALTNSSVYSSLFFFSPVQTHWKVAMQTQTTMLYLGMISLNRDPTCLPGPMYTAVSPHVTDGRHSGSGLGLGYVVDMSPRCFKCLPLQIVYIVCAPMLMYSRNTSMLSWFESRHCTAYLTLTLQRYCRDLMWQTCVAVNTVRHYARCFGGV